MRKHLYRFISFEDFINLVINNKDRFVRPSIWMMGMKATYFPLWIHQKMFATL